MQVLRTLGWIALTALVTAFVYANWNYVRVNLWPFEHGFNFVDWPVGLIAIVAFALGFLPMWLVHRAFRWRTAKRLAAMENSLRATSIAPAPVHTPVTTTEPLPPV